MKMWKIIVASTNPVKIQAVKEAFSRVFPKRNVLVSGKKIPSGVSDQPMTEAETLLGANNRASSSRKQFPEYDFFVGIEGGLSKVEKEMFAFAWVTILDRNGKSGRGRSGAFRIPPAVEALIDSGIELGIANDQVFGLEHSKQKQGAVGILTQNLIGRKDLYEPAIILALIPFIRAELFT